tara:strand:+ start:7136 stop:7396 length:261 start_codon:yes stop_codon:yes gene_type:complete
VKTVLVDLDKITKRFLMGEGKIPLSIRAYAEQVASILEHIAPKSQRETRQISIAKQHLQEIKRLNRKLEEKVKLLEEQIEILEEGK